MALTLRERCQRRLEGLKKTRQPYEEEAKEIATFGQPARSRWLSSDANKNVRQRNKRLNNSHGIFSFRTLQGGMTSGLSSPSRPWFTLTTHDDELKEVGPIKLWLAEAERLAYSFLAQTNFYAAAKAGYLELGLFGAEACVMEEHRAEGAVCHQLTFGEYWIGIGDSTTPDSLYRRCPMTVNQAVQKFDRSRLRPGIINAYDAGRYEEVCDFYHAIEPNDEFDDQYIDSRGMPFRSVYWDADTSGENAVARVSGYREQPFWAPRWETTGGDAWGIGPGHDALPDMRELQLQTKRKGEATDLVLWPEMIVPAKVKLRRQPKSTVTAADVDKDQVIVPYRPEYQAISVIAEDVQRCEQAIDRATYADLFMAITNMQGIQPRNIEEIASRNEEKLTQLGPVIERVNNEKLEVAIDRVFGIMQRAGLLPPAPEEVRQAGGDIKTEFVSILTQMQRMVGLGQIERTVGFIGNLAAVNPEALDKLNVDEAIDEYASRAGTPPKLIRTDAEVEEIRDSRAQQQNMDRMIAAAPAAKDGADAARLLAEASQGALPIAGAMPL
jgi:hypothetical protein